MNLQQEKRIAEQFRAIKDNKRAISDLHDRLCHENPTDLEIHALVRKFKQAPNPPTIDLFADEIKVKSPPSDELRKELGTSS